MKEKKSSNKKLLFTKKNYLISSIGLILILVGFIIMSGGESNDPNIFNKEICIFDNVKGLAKIHQTISYEILCRIDSELKRRVI